MHDVTIRPARRDDVDGIASLAGELGYPATAAEMEPRVTAVLMSSSVNAVLVAAVDEAVVGWIHVAIMELLESAPFAEIRGLVVTQARRGDGIGSRLVEEAEEWARERSITRIRVRSNVTRERTHVFYLARGYRTAKSQKVFDKQL